MLALRYHRHGPPEVLQVEEVPDPEPGAGEVLIRVRACGVNHLDLRNRSPQGEGRMALPRIPGADVAGELAAAGPGVELSEWGLREGDPVLVHPGLGCGRCPACRRGEDNLCPRYVILGWQRDGGCAQYVSVPVTHVHPRPADLPPAEAAAFPLVFLTAWHMLTARARLHPGETVLVLGASGGVGSATVVLAAFLGARVLATVTDQTKAERVRALGAAAVMPPGEALEAVRRLTEGRGVDVVVDHAGRATLPLALSLLTHGGRLVNCGATSGTEVELPLREFYRRHLSLLGSFMGTRGEMDTLLGLLANGRVRPVLDRVFPLTEAAAAHRYLEERRQVGKVVLAIP